MLQGAGATEEALNRVAMIRCSTCATNPPTTPLPRPARSQEAREFNEVVGFDTFELHDSAGDRFLFLNVVVFASRFQLCGPVEKTPESILRRFSDMWSQWAGWPRWVVCDQGGEFFGRFSEEAESQGCELFRIASNAPTQNGLVERRGGVWKHAAYRLIADQGLTGIDELRAMAVQLNHPRNVLPNRTGFSLQLSGCWARVRCCQLRCCRHLGSWPLTLLPLVPSQTLPRG